MFRRIYMIRMEDGLYRGWRIREMRIMGHKTRSKKKTTPRRPPFRPPRKKSKEKLTSSSGTNVRYIVRIGL
jgi:hypothetical protein